MSRKIFPKLLSDTILEIPGSPIIIVGLAELDSIQYAAMVNLNERDRITETYKAYINIVHLNSVKDTFKNNTAIYDDEEFQVLSDFFHHSGVFEMNRIERFIWAKIHGVPLIPRWIYEQADKKRRKVVGTKRTIKLEPQSSAPEIKWNQ